MSSLNTQKMAASFGLLSFGILSIGSLLMGATVLTGVIRGVTGAIIFEEFQEVLVVKAT